MAPIEFGYIVLNGPTAREGRPAFLAQTEQHLERIKGHFDSVWTADHLQAGAEDLLEGWTTVTYLAGRHPELLFGHTVLCQSFRNPALLAKMAATLQFLSGGRFIFGLGAGWHEPEYQAYNYPFPAPGVRVDELEEAVQIAKILWTTAPASFAGTHYRIADAYCEPRPDPAPLIMIGGREPRMLRLTARHADWWDVSGFGTGLERYRACAADMDRACAETGRDPATLRRTFSAPCACAPTEAAAQAMTEGFFDPQKAGFAGTPAQVIAQLRPYIALGVDHFQFMCADFPGTTTLDLLITEVLPALNG